jgi:DNA-binding response OmpR family regulator
MKLTIRVLIVGNDQKFLPYLKILLNNNGIEATVAYVLKDALELLNGNIYHLIISDYKMKPEEIVFYQWISHQKMPLIILEDEDDVNELVLSSNFVGNYLISKKSYNEHYLLNKIFYALK